VPPPHPHHPSDARRAPHAAHVPVAGRGASVGPQHARDSTPCVYHAAAGALPPAALAGPRSVPWVRRWATPVPAVVRRSRPPPRLPLPLCLRAWCRQARCDDAGAVCEAYEYSPSKCFCRLFGSKMSRSVPGLDSSWVYSEGNAIGGNTRITKGDGSGSSFTCHVKDPPPGQHRAWAHRGMGGAQTCFGECGRSQAVGAGAGAGTSRTPIPLVLHAPPWCYRTDT